MHTEALRVERTGAVGRHDGDCSAVYLQGQYCHEYYRKSVLILDDNWALRVGSRLREIRAYGAPALLGPRGLGCRVYV